MLKKLLMIAAIVATVLLSACGVSVEDSGSGKDREEKQPKATQEVKQNNDDKQPGKNNDPGTDVNPGNSDDGGNNNGDNGNGNNDNGNNYAGENNGQDDPYQGDNGNNNGNNNENNEYAGAKAEIMLYKLDDNTLVVNVTGPMCTKVKAKPDGGLGESEFYLSMNNGETRMEMISEAFHGWSGEGDNTVYFSATPQYHNGIIVICEDRYYCVVTEENLWNRVKLNGDYVLKYGETYRAEYEGFEVAEGKVSDIIGTIDEETKNNMFVEAMTSVKADNPADPVWNGGYLMGYSWEGKNGYIEAEVLEGGLIKFHVVTDDGEKIYFAKQTEYDKAEYSYGSYIKAVAEAVMLDGYNKHAKFELRTDPDKATELKAEISEYDYEDRSKDFYVSNDFQLFTPWHTAPSDYSDSDPYDLIGFAQLSSDPVFTPVNDNYALAVRDKSSVYIDNERSVNCKYAMLTSFDENETMVQKVEQYIFDNSGDAEAYYQKCLKYVYNKDPYKKAGNSVYYTYEPESIYYYNKKDGLGSYINSDKIYYDCHYLYNESEYNGRCVVYLSQPISSEYIKMGIKDAARWKKMYGKDYYSKDMKGVQLCCRIDNYSISVSIEGETGANKYRFGTINNVRLDGTKVVGMTTDYSYDYKTDKYLYQVIFRTLEFTDTEAVASDYFFDVDDITNHGITFDNFKDKQAAQVISQTFDLTRTAD